MTSTRPEGEPGHEPEEVEPAGGAERPDELGDGVDVLTAHPAEVPQPEPPRMRRGLRGWVGKRAKKVVQSLYESKAEDLEERAKRVVSSAYRDSAEDIEERAVRAMRRAIELEADRIKDVIEHSVRVKKREVRLSLLVLVAASILYLLLYWATHGGGGA